MVNFVYAIGKIIQSRKRAGSKVYCFFLEVQKDFGTVWRDSIYQQLSQYGINRKMWRKLKTTRVSTALSCSAGNYETSPTLSTGSHQDECSPQHCPRCLSTVSYADSGGGNRARVTGRRRGVSRLLLTDSFVGMFATSGGLQKQIDAAMEFIWKWKLSANVKR